MKITRFPHQENLSLKLFIYQKLCSYFNQIHKMPWAAQLSDFWKLLDEVKRENKTLSDDIRDIMEQIRKRIHTN